MRDRNVGRRRGSASLGALHGLRGDVISASRIAAEAHRLETEVLGRESGIQDHIAAAHGGVNFIEVDRYPEAVVTRLNSWPGLEAALSLVYVGRPHDSSQVHRAGHPRNRYRTAGRPRAPAGGGPGRARRHRRARPDGAGPGGDRQHRCSSRPAPSSGWRCRQGGHQGGLRRRCGGMEGERGRRGRGLGDSPDDRWRRPVHGAGGGRQDRHRIPGSPDSLQPRGVDAQWGPRRCNNVWAGGLSDRSAGSLRGDRLRRGLRQGRGSRATGPHPGGNRALPGPADGGAKPDPPPPPRSGEHLPSDFIGCWR